jgi:hypothetical protein
VGGGGKAPNDKFVPNKIVISLTIGTPNSILLKERSYKYLKRAF